MLRLFQRVCHYADFTKLSNKLLSRPEVVKDMLRVPVYGKERKAQHNLYQGKRSGTAVQSCFSEKKYLAPHVDPPGRSTPTSSKRSSTRRCWA